jgi:hypothetical protein
MMTAEQQPQMLSSPGLTGRSSMPGALDFISDAGDYWIPWVHGDDRYAGMTEKNDEGRQ